MQYTIITFVKNANIEPNAFIIQLIFNLNILVKIYYAIKFKLKIK